MRRAPVIATLIALAAAGCTGWSSHGQGSGEGQPHGMIEATVRLVGGPAPGNRLMRREAIEVLAGRQLVARVRTDAHGRFRLSIVPGLYRFRLCGGPDLRPLTPVVVTATHTTRLHLILNAK
jgi:hypothetical protein